MTLEAITGFLSTSPYAVLGVVALVLFLLVWKGKRLLKCVIKDKYPSKEEILSNREIYTELVSLRAITGADRAFICRFHNGSEFLPGDTAWKASRTHESVKHGVTYESPNTQNFLVSRVPEIVDPLISGVGYPGVNVVECPEDCPNRQRCLRDNKRIIVTQVDEMSGGFSKFYLEGQNIKTQIACGISIRGNVCGRVSLDFCDAKLTPESITMVVGEICKTTDRIQYYMSGGPLSSAPTKVDLGFLKK